MERFERDFEAAGSSSPEEAIRIAIASREEFSSDLEFLDQCPRDAAVPAEPLQYVPWKKFQRAEQVAEELKRFGVVWLPGESAVVAQLTDDWDEVEVLIQDDDRRIWYHWETSA
jgi:hypothetical protein